MIGFDVPLNQGCLNPIEIKLKEGSILCPSDSAAVVGGNVLTSQRVVDVVLKAFFSVSASQEFISNISSDPYPQRLGHTRTSARRSPEKPFLND